MKIAMAVVFVASVFGTARQADACASAMGRARAGVQILAHAPLLQEALAVPGRSLQEVLTDKLTDAHISYNQGKNTVTLRSLELIIADKHFASLTAHDRADAHLLAAHAAFALKQADVVTHHYTAAVKASPKLQKNFDAAQILMASWVRPAPVVAAPVLAEVKQPEPTTMDALHWAALVEARFMTHDEEGARSALADGLKEHPGSEALLDLKARLPPEPEGEVVDTFSNY